MKEDSPKRNALKVAVIAIIVLALASVGLYAADKYTACTVQPFAETDGDAAPAIIDSYTSLRLSFNTLYIKPGQQAKIEYTYYDENKKAASPATVTYSAAGESAAVSADGTITANAEGDTVVLVTAKSENTAGTAAAAITVHVTESAEWYGGATYYKGILIVNKEFSIPESYDPGGILPEVQAAADSMFAAAQAQGYHLWIQSGYRSYGYQTALYNKYLREWGVAATERFSAKPGHSEHQTGMCFDLNTITESFGYTAAGKWVAEHAHEYGFIVRYPDGKQQITGYGWEPWHLRYIGVKAAAAVYESGLSLEEFLGLKTLITY